MLNKKILALAVLFLGVLVVFSARMASAHVTQSDGSISVLFHTDPDDDPIIGQPTQLWFDVTDKDGRFEAVQCDCAIAISEDRQQLMSAPLPLSDASSSIFSFKIPFTFPEAAIYTVAVTGHPKASGDFQSFQVTYDLNVARKDWLPTSTSLSHLFHSEHSFHLLLFIWPVPIAVILLIVERSRQKTKRDKDQNKN